jgi:ArsR family transcriptional regulator, arsenate/arsenite/antimonite-responsive transcriptional repressor
MESIRAILTFSALAQETRLGVFRLLVRSEPEGMAAGDIARELAVPHNTMSSHLGVLARAGLVTAERRSRSIVYRANLDAARDVVTFLLQDCCGGRPEICSLVVDALTPCCPEEPAHG